MVSRKGRMSSRVLKAEPKRPYSLNTMIWAPCLVAFSMSEKGQDRTG